MTASEVKQGPRLSTPRVQSVHHKSVTIKGNQLLDLATPWCDRTWLQGQLEEAEEFFKKSLSIHEDGRGHYNLANVLRNQGNLSLSISHYRKAIELGSGEAEFYSDLGDALWHDGNISEANRFLRMAVDVDSQHPRSNYQLAVFLYDNKAFEEAINYFRVSKFEDWQERILYCFYKLKQFSLDWAEIPDDKTFHFTY